MEKLTLTYDLNDLSIGRLALLMSLTPTIAQEQLFRDYLKSTAYVGCFTEIGGTLPAVSAKLSKAVIGASLNNGVILKTPYEVHALLHAAEEALKAFLTNTSSSVNLAVKVCVVRGEHWIAVAIFGYSAMTTLTNHERSGLGVMHI